MIGRFPLARPRDLPGYIKEGRTPPLPAALENQLPCRGSGRAAFRRFNRGLTDRTVAANIVAEAFRMKKAIKLDERRKA